MSNGRQMIHYAKDRQAVAVEFTAGADVAPVVDLVLDLVVLIVAGDR